VAEAAPELADEWDEVRNRRSAEWLTCGSSARVWWVCGACKWSWRTAVVNRAVKGSGCPKCRELVRGSPRRRGRRILNGEREAPAK